jgi:hypothetical protein
MMLFLRALVILGAVLAVVSCRSALAAELGGGEASIGSGGSESCLSLTYSWETVPGAGGTISDSGTGYCL